MKSTEFFSFSIGATPLQATIPISVISITGCSHCGGKDCAWLDVGWVKTCSQAEGAGPGRPELCLPIACRGHRPSINGNLCAAVCASRYPGQSATAPFPPSTHSPCCSITCRKKSVPSCGFHSATSCSASQPSESSAKKKKTNKMEK